jgi:threonine/homoserine/homoserine lactone efflux protein
MPLPNDVLLSLVAFAFVASVTPGPNNLMLMASGVNFGLKRSIPHMLGILVGFVAMTFGVGLGLGAALKAAPVLYAGLRWISIGYLLWLAWKIATAPTGFKDAPGAATPLALAPMSFAGAALFQLVNPKAWMTILSAVAAFSVTSNYQSSIVVIAAVFALVSVPSILIWTMCGIGLRSFLANPVRLRVFNVAMALVLVASITPLMSEAVSHLLGSIRVAP